jgi:hypothetical protein
MSDLEFYARGVLAILGLACVLACVRHRRHNKRINLPPPSVACRRNGPEAAP